MQHFLDRLASLWLKNIHPRINSFIAFFGVGWLVICVLTAYLLIELSDEVLEQETFAFDKDILLFIHQFANPVLDNIMVGITRIGDPHTVVPLTAVVFCLLLWKRRFTEAKFFALNAAGGATLSYFLKLAFSKPRPELWTQPISEITYSYPSGHALGSMVLYGFLAYLLATFYPRYAKVVYAIATCLIIGIGFSRLYLGVHWPTDIVGGYGIGFLWLSVCVMLMRLEKMKTAQPEELRN